MRKRLLSLLIAGMVLVQGMVVSAEEIRQNHETGEIDTDFTETDELLAPIRYYQFETYEDMENSPDRNNAILYSKEIYDNDIYEMYEGVLGSVSKKEIEFNNGKQYETRKEYTFYDGMNNEPMFGDIFDPSVFNLFYNDKVENESVLYEDADYENYEEYGWEMIEDATFYLINNGKITDTYGTGINLVVCTSRQYYDDIGHFQIGDKIGYNPLLGKEYFIEAPNPVIEIPSVKEKTEEKETFISISTEPESDLTEIEDEPSPNWFPWFPAIIVTGAIGVFLWILWKRSRVTIHGALTESDGAFRVVKTDGDKDTAELLQETIDRLHAECRFDLASYLNEAFGSGYVTKIPSRTKITITDAGSGTATSIRADEKKLYEILQKAEEQKAHVFVSFVYDNTSAELEFDFTEE